MSETTGWPRSTSPFHPGEQELQARLGIRERQDALGRRIIRPFMTDQHRRFFNQLPFMVVGSVDSHGSPWASIVFGRDGFITTPTDKKLHLQTTPTKGDPLAGNLQVGSSVSFLGIELPTKRRNRANGVIAEHGQGYFETDVVQSFGNCPKYIHTRSMSLSQDTNLAAAAEPREFNNLDMAAIELIARSDTLFVASHNNQDDVWDTGGVDVNHRGGEPGFVNVAGDTLTVPDYVGNFAFNTLGNFVVNPRAGLLFIDFDTGDILQLTGTVELIWDRTPEVSAMRGAQRAWRFTLTRGVRLTNAVPK